MKNKIIFLILPIILLAASCNPFQKPIFSGIVKTVNGGVDWQFSNSIKGSKTSSLQSVNISKMAFDPKNRETVFASGYTSGLFKSEDSGGSWTKILSKIGVYDFVINPYDPKIIYVAGYYSGFGKVLKTTDGGGTWVEVFNATEDTVRTIVFNPQDPNQLLIGTDSGNIISSSDAGQSLKPNWKSIKEFGDRVQRIFWQNGEIFVLLKTKGLYKNSNLDGNFQVQTDVLSRTVGLDNFSYNPDAIKNFYQMFVDVLSNNLIYITTDRGVYKSVDEGKAWTFLPLPVKADASEARAISIARSSSNIVFTSVGATIFKSVDGGNTWQTQSISTTGFVNYILIDPQLAQITYGGIYVSQ